jgi:hypothetical protein
MHSTTKFAMTILSKWASVCLAANMYIDTTRISCLHIDIMYAHMHNVERYNVSAVAPASLLPFPHFFPVLFLFFLLSLLFPFLNCLQLQRSGSVKSCKTRPEQSASVVEYLEIVFRHIDNQWYSIQASKVFSVCYFAQYCSCYSFPSWDYVYSSCHEQGKQFHPKSYLKA